MKNFVQEGDRVTLTAPYARSAGDGALVGATFGVALNDVANGASGEFDLEGTFDLTAASAATASMGALAYWDDTNKNVTATSSGNTKIGVFLVAKTNGQTTARIRLNGAF